MWGTIGLIHTCSIHHETVVSHDEYGAPVYDTTYTTHRCRFFQANSNSRIIDIESGKHAVSTPVIMLPADVDITVGQKLDGDALGYRFTFEVTNVIHVFGLFDNHIHHIECDLKAVK